MPTLNDVLNELRLVLLDEEEPIEEMENIADAIEYLVYPGKLSEVDDGELAQITVAQKNLFDALVHCQSVSDLYSTIAFDGLMSIFYNATGSNIDKLRATVRDNEDPISAPFEKAYALLAPVFDIQPGDNWVMRNRGKQPHDVTSEKIQHRIDSIEDSISEMQDSVCERAVEGALAAAKQA